MTIDVTVTKSIRIRGKASDIYTAASDVTRTGVFSPGVESIAALGENKFSWTLTKQSAFGIEFEGEYVTQHEMIPGKISWTTISGNMQSSGYYVFEPDQNETIITGSISTSLPLKVPAIFKKPVEHFVHHNLIQQIVDLFKKIETELVNAA